MLSGVLARPSSNAATAVAIARFTIALVFLAAALAKAQAPQSLADTIRLLGLPARLSPGLARTVVAWEGGAAVYLLSGYRVTVADVCIVALTLTLASASVWALASRRVVACSCFGVEEKPLGLQTLALSGTLALAAAGSLLSPRTALTGSRLIGGWALAVLVLTLVRAALIAPAFVRIWLQRRHLRGLFTQSRAAEA